MTPWVLRLLVANIVVFLITMVSPAAELALRLVPAWVLVRPWTVVTYMFVHAGLWHLFFNMLALYFFGPRLEQEIGSRHFLWLYLFSGLMGALLSFIFTPFSAIVGASGAVFGVMYAFARYWPREQVFLWGILPVEVRWLVIGGAALALLGGFGGGGDNIAHFAHLGGFAGGFIYIRMMERLSRRRRLQRHAKPPAPRTSDIARWSRIRRDQLHEVNRAELDRIMAKLQTSGAESLTGSEREFLNRFSESGEENR